MSACMFDCDCCVLLVNVYAKIDIQNISTTKYRRYLIVSKLEKKERQFHTHANFIRTKYGQIKRKPVHSLSKYIDFSLCE